MSELIQQKKKGKKSYDELLAELDDIFSKTAAVAIPQLCETLKEENPDWDNKTIQNKVEKDVSKYWGSLTVYTYLPSWVHDEAIVKRQKKAWETRHANEKNAIRKNLIELAKKEFKEPKLPEEKSTPFEDLEDEADTGGSMLQEYGGSQDTILGIYAKINGPAKDLFKALTQKEMPPSKIDDLVLEFLKPSREFRSGVFYEVDANMRTSLYNTLVWTRDAIDDTLDILEKIDKGKTRTKEIS